MPVTHTKVRQGGCLRSEVASLEVSHPEGRGGYQPVIPATSSDEIVTTSDSTKHFSDHDVLTLPCFQSLSPYVELTKTSD